MSDRSNLSITRSDLGVTFQAPQCICRKCARELEARLLDNVQVVVPLNMAALTLGINLTISAQTAEGTVRSTADQIWCKIEFCRNGHKPQTDPA
jgi:hypothetical protein